MKYNFFFVHGWAFDSKFWVMVGELIKKKEYFNSIEYINLGFIDKKNLKKTQPENCVYIVHSYGLNWFLKKKIKCKILITFFAAPEITAPAPTYNKGLMDFERSSEIFLIFSESPLV